MRRVNESGGSGTFRALASAGLLLGLLGNEAGCGTPPPGPNCNPGDLAAALAAARAGDTVRVGACRLTGPFAVPADVTLVGAGPGRTILVAPAGGRAVEIAGGATASVASDLSVESAGCAGMVATGPGAVDLERLDVRASRGIGVGAQGLAALTMGDVSIAGPISPDAAATTIPPLAPYACADTALATHGLVVVDVPQARLTNVTASQFGAFGALFVRSTFRWQGGGAFDDVGVGLEAYAGAATLDGVSLCRMHQASGPVEIYGGVFAANATVQSTNLVVCDNEGFGIVHENGTATHVDLVARNNVLAGVWLQGSGPVVLSGAATALTGNGFAGIGAVDSFDVQIRDATIGGTVSRTRPFMVTGMITAADGVQLVRTPAMLANVTLAGNERVGLLVELGGGSTDLYSLAGVSVDGSGTELGAIAQDGIVNAGWDSGVTRRGATATNDPSFAARLDVAGIIAPNCLPQPDQVVALGLPALIGP